MIHLTLDYVALSEGNHKRKATRGNNFQTGRIEEKTVRNQFSQLHKKG